MTNSNLLENLDKVNILNADIREILIEVLPVVSPEIQLEITDLVQRQVHHINYLINKPKNSWTVSKFKPNNSPIKYILLLEEIKSILIISKTNNISPETIREFRLNLEKEVNSDRYFFWGYILNILSYIYYAKSIPFKILIGLSITTLVSFIIIVFSVHNLYLFDETNSTKKSEEQVINSIDSQDTSHHDSTNNRQISQQASSNNSTNSNKHLIYSTLIGSMAGVLGSVASILLRIIDFRDQKYEDPLLPLFIGLLKPLLGLIFGIFICALINSNTIIKIDFLIQQDEKSSISLENRIRQDLFIFCCAFLVGFSERFASDLLKKSESAIIENKS